MADTKWSQFPSATPGNSDEVVGLHSGDNARFSIANIIAAVRQGLASIFVPKSDVGAAGGVASLDSNGKVPSGQLPSSTGPEPATTTPLMDGTGAVGTSTKYAREDHEHPADTNKQSKITASGILKGDGAGGVSAAVAGTDYQAPLTAGTDYATPAQLAGKANQAQLATAETGNTASRAYAVGEYFCWNGNYYQAIAPIAVGVSFVPDQNCKLTSIGAEISRKEETGTITYTRTLGSGTFQQWNCYKINNVVSVAARVYDVNEPANGVFFNVPAGFRPRVKTYFMCYWVRSGGVFNTTFGYVDTNGDVAIQYSSSQYLVQWGFAITYPI